MHQYTTQAWKVVKHGQDTGIVESNYFYARKYWDERSKATGFEFELIGIRQLIEE